jgi:hypothetical protein
VRDQNRNVLPAISERRQKDEEGVQPIVQIAAKLTASDHLDHVPIRCRHQRDIHFVCATPVQSLELLFLQHGQQLRLQRRMEVAYFVQKQRVVVGHFVINNRY